MNLVSYFSTSKNQCAKNSWAFMNVPMSTGNNLHTRDPRTQLFVFVYRSRRHHFSHQSALAPPSHIVCGTNPYTNYDRQQLVFVPGK
jgi:hypothetical protein